MSDDAIPIVRDGDMHQMRLAWNLDWIMLHHGEIAYWMAAQYKAQPFSGEARVILDGGRSPGPGTGFFSAVAVRPLSPGACRHRHRPSHQGHGREGGADGSSSQ
ncbi:hypothetical protein DA69_02020 [Brevundimonas naejangsanensis]|uniref:Uncharacterized protein n=1 Tax=Brevundimonas naejangsanensis TaxID=588932 RepID=A0A172Y358_9CAUL|nr:hypothetical protein DA69_02020 [Brevundimonas naejangsanensis]